MTIKEFVDAYKAKTFMNTPQGLSEKAEWLRGELGIKDYVPFNVKREIAETIVHSNIKVVDGIKKYNSIDGYVSLIVSSIIVHTNLKFSENPVGDYDTLAESGLLPQIIAQFQGSHDEIDLLRKMVLEMELEDNQPGALIGRFLDSILQKLDGAAGVLNGIIGNLDLEKMFSEENVAKIVGFLNK
jgi:hypothetical protein